MAVIGPTATGKTVIAASIAKAIGSEVISADSQLVYQDLQIGVARPTPEETQGVPHHMIGIIPPTEVFSAGEYANLARPILENLLSQGQIPVLCGGTGFYIRALLQPNCLPDVPVDPVFRETIAQTIEQYGLETLYKQLETLDPERAGEIHPNDQVRIIRALEIIEATGQKVPRSEFEFAYPVQAIGLTYQNRELHVKMIRKRLETMVATGFLEEVQAIYTRYGDCFALQNAHGYPELLKVIYGEMTLEQALDQIEINIRQYSKRQMTWFRRFPGIHWYEVDVQSKYDIITDVIKRFV